MSGCALIGIDWGSTNLRAYRFDGDGRVLATRESANGILNVPGREFAAVLRDACADWIAETPGIAILMSGMIGSRQGWVEAPYVECPANTIDIARKLTRVDVEIGSSVRIVPGLSVQRENGIHDVMRGEETQVLGAIETNASGLLIAPGTHSKWIEVEGGSIRRLQTFMTGELYSLLRSHSLLGRSMTGAEHDEETFVRGVRVGLNGDLAGDLFGVRTEALFARIAPAALASYLSGLLIGAEIFSATHGSAGIATSPERLRQQPAIRIVGTTAISDLYRVALAQAGAINVELVDAHRATARGLWNIAALRDSP
jgi:2-dehydro-3-deoxygalactonokinase